MPFAGNVHAIAGVAEVVAMRRNEADARRCRDTPVARGLPEDSAEGIRSKCGVRACASPRKKYRRRYAMDFTERHFLDEGNIELLRHGEANQIV